MINIKNILRVLMIAMFICVCSSGDGFAVVGNSQIDMLGQQGKISTVTGSGGNSSGYTISSSTTTSPTSNTKQDATFCGADKGVFSELIMTGQKIFNRLRDLIYVVAGFGIIAVAVGGFFGNLNWKWLGAIIISLVVIASAGELIVLLTGCPEYGKTLITNTLESPTTTATAVK